MCGVPFHSCEPYINKLVEKGFRVAICEQVEDPKAAKGIVKRDVIRVVTPGTNVMTQSLDESKNNFIMSVFCEDDLFGIGVCDLSTGEFRTTQVEHQDALFDEMNKFQPSEIICNDAFVSAAWTLTLSRIRSAQLFLRLQVIILKKIIVKC